MQEPAHVDYWRAPLLCPRILRTRRGRTQQVGRRATECRRMRHAFQNPAVKTLCSTREKRDRYPGREQDA